LESWLWCWVLRIPRWIVALFGVNMNKDQDIANWLFNNNGATDAQMRAAMDQNGVTISDMARVTGGDFGEIASRYVQAGLPQQQQQQTQQPQPQQYQPAQSAPQSSTQSSGSPGYTPNPYLGQMATSITNQVNQNLQRNIMPSIQSGAQAAGGFGGSRQGVVEANALNDANQGLSNSLTNMYYGDFTNSMNRALQQQSLDNSYSLGVGNLGLGYTQAQNSYNLGLGNLGLNAQNSQNNFYTAQRGQDMQQMGLGSQLSQAANQGYLNQGSGVYDIGSQYQSAPWQTMGNFNSAATPYTGYGATSTTSQGTNPWAQALGGAAMGAQLGRLF
jgi:hypothetical protein